MQPIIITKIRQKPRKANTLRIEIPDFPVFLKLTFFEKRVSQKTLIGCAANSRTGFSIYAGCTANNRAGSAKKQTAPRTVRRAAPSKTCNSRAAAGPDFAGAQHFSRHPARNPRWWQASDKLTETGYHQNNFPIYRPFTQFFSRNLTLLI